MFELFPYKTPEFIQVADKPLSYNPEIRRVKIEEFEKEISKHRGVDFKWTETILVPPDIQEKNNIEKLDKAPVTCFDWSETLVICFINDDVGYGVFTTKFIPKGTIICIYAGMALHKADGDDAYTFQLQENPLLVISAKHRGGIGSFFQSLLRKPIQTDSDCSIAFENLTARGFRSKISPTYFIATNDIFPQEQLGFYYGYDYWYRASSLKIQEKYFLITGEAADKISQKDALIIEKLEIRREIRKCLKKTDVDVQWLFAILTQCRMSLLLELLPELNDTIQKIIKYKGELYFLKDSYNKDHSLYAKLEDHNKGNGKILLDLLDSEDSVICNLDILHLYLQPPDKTVNEIIKSAEEMYRKGKFFDAARIWSQAERESSRLHGVKSNIKKYEGRDLVCHPQVAYCLYAAGEAYSKAGKVIERENCRARLKEVLKNENCRKEFKGYWDFFKTLSSKQQLKQEDKKSLTTEIETITLSK